ncbi:putative HTH-type transcriptional regulator [Candidatus Bilamarchaeum dharawalense]|uniref:Putative HTH-type transcriptional regulator n=1 Tax=Candidatus Bilamarchaeum dharawalense TaxID=2885759 RepID=A0A5E4LMR3_9ARCH|nr:putative HTH-type transcriptional regulator [Candidatus Bilamarchaeum dharawalense]
MKNKIDTVDLLILRELRNDCKRPMRELAQKLRMHPNTLLQRIKRLEKSKIIRKYHADIDFKSLGYDMHAVVMIKIKKSGLENEKLLEEVAELPEIQSLYAVTGGADCIAVVKAKNRDDLVRVLRIVQTQESVLRTTSYLVLITYKESFQFNPLSSVLPSKD